MERTVKKFCERVMERTVLKFIQQAKEERRVFQKDGIIRKVKEKNGASGSCQ